MKLALVFLAVLPLVLSGPLDEKRFLEFLHLDRLVEQLKGVVHSDTGHAGCVVACQAFASVASFLCDAACTKVLALVH